MKWRWKLTNENGYVGQSGGYNSFDDAWRAGIEMVMRYAPPRNRNKTCIRLEVEQE